ncbi:ABC transporter substrate-binding protein [Falsiroseomonas sp. CW058]|uniref:ABC transporter substrate-binding protein n=1 Tax=Falsiroseomonas sp. CW058 TaxID=3388664 RepID=UPI003D322D6F
MHHLRIAAENCRFLPPDRVTDDTSVLTLKALVFEPLLRWRDGTVLPGLLAGWEASEGGRRWRFRIRPGAAFHDGVPCTADHVLGTIGRILESVDSFGMRWAYARYFAQTRLSAPAPDILMVENPTPFADLPDILTEFFAVREDAAGAPVLGTGPYRVAAHAPGGPAVLERLRGTGPDRITFAAIAGAEARLDALREGYADAAMNLERLEAGPDFAAPLAWGRSVNTLSVMFYLNCREGAFAHPAARRAVNHAVDRRAIIDRLFHGLGVEASTVVSPLHLGMRAAPPAPIPHDPDLARRLFDAAGIGGPLHLRTPLTMPEKAREVSEAVAQDLARIGIATRIEVQPDRPEYAREVGRKRIGDMAIFDSTPHGTFRVLNDKISSAVQGPWWQGHDDPVLEPLIEAANRATGDAEREAAYAACLHRLNANPPWLYLFHPVEVFASRPGTAPLRLDGTGALHLA